MAVLSGVSFVEKTERGMTVNLITMSFSANLRLVHLLLVNQYYICIRKPKLQTQARAAASLKACGYTFWLHLRTVYWTIRSTVNTTIINLIPFKFDEKHHRITRNHWYVTMLLDHALNLAWMICIEFFLYFQKYWENTYMQIQFTLVFCLLQFVVLHG